MNSIVQKIKSRVVLISLLLLTGGIGAWAQEPENYSGTYYIKTSGKLGDNKQPAGNYYLCPTEGWCYYKATNDFSSEDTGMPFLTSYQCLNSTYGYDDATEKAVWIVEKHPTENYYYIKRASDGKYIVLSGKIRTTTNDNRMRLHLEALTNPDDKALFTFEEYSGALSIKPKTLATYLTVNGSNFNTLKGEAGKGNGPTGYTNTAGIIGIFGTKDDNSKFYLEPTVYIVPPTITNNNDGTFTITAPEGTIHYTTDGSNPTAESPVCSKAFTPPTETDVIKAIAVVGENASGVKTMPLHTYTYYIINRAGDIAIKTEVKQAVGKSLTSIDDIPAAIRSSYLAEESASFYSFTDDYSADKLIDENKIYATPSADAPIYITYTTDHLSDKFLRLRGARAFNIKNLSDHYAYDNAGTLAYEDANNTELSHLWNIGGSEDPYDVKIKNIGTESYLVFSTPPTLTLAVTATTKFILMEGSAAGDGTTYEQVKLMAVTGTGSNDFSKVEIRAYPYSISTTYHLIDKAGKLIASIPSSAAELSVPDDWQSPLVSAYHYFRTASIDGSGVYTLSNTVTSPFDSNIVDGNIYVNYDVSDAIDLEGTKTYMMRFSDGESFNQENGSDGIYDTQTKAEYPYNNGDFNLYVYGKRQWDEQLRKGASTRSRWLWYIISNHNGTDLTGADVDPYHVIVKSYQEQLIKAKKDNESEHKFIGHNYLRTYKPEGYASVVTGVSYENAEYNQYYRGIMPESRVDGNPTEYMLTGTSLNKVKLVTLDAIDDGTTNERRTVNSFEQYWKTFDTVKKNMYGSESTDESEPATIPADAKAKYGSSTSKLLRDSLEDIGWHSYSKWTYAKRWNGRNAQGELKKGLESIEHWFQTIDMGSGEFVFEEVSLEPQVILLDNHGWEIARVPLYTNYKEAGQAVNTAGLNAYNSPMVEQYHWYSTSVKATGYHKFTVSGDAYHDSSSLSDIPTGMEAGKEPDFYVTYDVKARYASAYKGAAKADDTKPSAYLLKQGGKYAKTSGSTIDKTDAPDSLEDVPKDMQWYLKPNFDIDREMGYRYAGESGAQEEAKSKDATEQDYYDAGKNGFDPYNVQIQNREYDKRYFTTNSSAMSLNSGIWTGTSTQVIMQNLNVKQHATGYDQTTLNITNATFMVVGDANGNMRLMPRFDNTKVTNKDGSDNPFRALEEAAAETAGNEGTGNQTLWLELVPEAKEIHSSSEMTEMNGHYILADDFTFDSDFTSLGTYPSAPFTGTIDGQLNIISSPGKAIVAYANGAQIYNIILDNVTITNGGKYVGAICNVADGSTRIYNCGVNGGEIGGTTNVGGIVGWLKGSSRVINCYSYANITSGTNRAGIVGNNNETSTQASLTTMIMNCMFYGDIADGETISPIYGGTEINNVEGGMNNYNYYRYGSRYSVEKKITKYNRALAMEEKFINRFERYRLLLNSNKNLAAKYADINPNELAKWVLETADRSIAEPKPYPVLKKQGQYPSIINYDAENAPDSASVGRLNGGKLGKTLDVTIYTKSQKTTGGQSWPTASGSDVFTTSLTLIRTDKDTVRYNFNYDKVQLPYYNDIGTGNYTENRVVTGWKITSITGGTPGTYTASDSWGGYNFADRKCTNKDLYSVTGRVFSQGAYWDVPEGVTAITIEPYWAIANYVSDETYDVVYKNDYTKPKQTFTPFGAQYVNGAVIDIYGDGSEDQHVYTSISDALTGFDNSSKTVYDQAVVLVGNVHQAGNPTTDDTPYTLMSIDMNHDNEPDYSYIFGHNDRQQISPFRYDFLNIMGIAEAQIPTGATKFRNVSIFKPKGWIEITNTCIVNFSQFEYYNGSKKKAPLILLGGTYEQFVSTKVQDPIDIIDYIHVGSNAWFAKFGNGTHSDGKGFTYHVPVSVTGGDYDEFYLSGTYQPTITNMKSDDAECYVSGGRFGEMAGASLEAIWGDVRWDIDWADITNFYGGGVNAVNPITGDISVDMTRSHVERYCGGPKFGDMAEGKTVTTNATDCVFGTYFGAGYGGNAYNRLKYKDKEDTEPASHQGDYASEREKYYDGTTSSTTYGKKGKGVATDFDYEFFIWSTGITGSRFYVKFVTFSLATTHGVTSNLTNCKVTGNVYGGGSLGWVTGDVSTTLNNCKVNGNVFGAGYSATLPTIGVRNKPAFIAGKEPKKNTNIGMFEPGEINTTKVFEWKQVESSKLVNGKSGMETTEEGNEGNYVYTDQDLHSLGTVKGDVTLTINGTTTVAGNVYGGGEQSNVTGDTKINLKGGVITGDVFGGGKGVMAADGVEAVAAKVGGTQVNLNTTVEDDGNGNNSYPDNCVVKGRIFGCNDLNGTPLGNATVHVGKTVGYEGHMRTEAEDIESIDDSKHSYEVSAVYGGGNMAAYEPTAADATTHVIIDGCGLTSIKQVYGGGNAASTPATHVTVNGTYEIDEVFGGGNGKDDITINGVTKANPGANVGYKDYSEFYEEDGVWKVRDKADADTKAERTGSSYVYGTGEAKVDIFGGRVHSVFGGSNTKGNVRQTVVTTLNEAEGGCGFCVDEAYGGGKSAPMDAEAELRIGCIPGLKAVYGGAEAADMNGDVTLNITNGTYERVFGGNNISGTIRGSITVNIEETGCRPILIGELYGGGNEAAYSVYGYNDDSTIKESGETPYDDPQVNVKSFTSIGNIYGGGFGETAVMVGNPTVNINEVVTLPTANYPTTGDFDATGFKAKEMEIGDHTVTLPAHVRGKIGAIGNVFGGGNAAKVIGNTQVNIGTLSTINFNTKASGEENPRTGVTVEGVDIRGNVYGGGNNAEVTGDANVNIGNKVTTP